MKYPPNQIRNVVLLGHSGAGKTSFVECMLYEAKAINRLGNLSNKTTVSDYTDIERDRGNSIYSTLMHVIWKESKINIIDTPGYDDFVGEVISALKVADTGLLLLNATQGVEVSTELVWDYMKEFKTPGIFVVNQLDREKADYNLTIEQAIERFGNNVIPIQYPYENGLGFTAIIDALRMVMYVFGPDGGKPKKESIPESELNRAQEMHNRLVEVAAENDEELMERFFEDGTLNEEELAEGLTIALSNREFFPVFCCSSTENKGSGRIMGFINDIAPSPPQRAPAPLKDGGTLPCSLTGAPTLFIYKTLTVPRVGTLSYFKVYAGKVQGGDEFSNNRNRSTERLSQLYLSNGKDRETVDKLGAGDLGVVLKLKDALTNDTLTSKNTNHEIAPIIFPNPRIRRAVIPPAKAEMEKLMKAIHQIEMEDPTLLIEQSAQLKQTLLHGQGQLHLDLIKYRIEKVNGISMEYEKPRIPYRETITASSEANYRHKKQSGGSGQFAEIYLRIEPYYEGMPDPKELNLRKTIKEDLPWGGKLVLSWCIVGGSIDVKYINAIKKGIINEMESGPLTDSCMQDIRVSVYDGKMHSVDSNDMAFMLATQQAFKQAFEGAKPQVLEPIYEMEILCSGDIMGDVMGDLQTRRATITGMSAEGHYQKIMAKVPLAELYQYSSTLRSMSKGKAKFKREFSEYAVVPYEIQKELVQS
ncbi:MAG: elongation factor G [Saprospiraceae bacterium]|jgi:elongation factor G